VRGALGRQRGREAGRQAGRLLPKQVTSSALDLGSKVSTIAILHGNAETLVVAAEEGIDVLDDVGMVQTSGAE
jgi:hypothetical protein